MKQGLLFLLLPFYAGAIENSDQMITKYTFESVFQKVNLDLCQVNKMNLDPNTLQLLDLLKKCTYEIAADSQGSYTTINLEPLIKYLASEKRSLRRRALLFGAGAVGLSLAVGAICSIAYVFKDFRIMK
jgi:hypothetical protein